MAKRQRDYKAEYRARVKRARAEGYKGYGQKRYQRARMLKLKSQLEQDIAALVEQYGGETVTFEEVAPNRLRKLDEAKQMGATDEDMKWLYDLARTQDSQFWKAWRELYNKMGTK